MFGLVFGLVFGLAFGLVFGLVSGVCKTITQHKVNLHCIRERDIICNGDQLTKLVRAAKLDVNVSCKEAGEIVHQQRENFFSKGWRVLLSMLILHSTEPLEIKFN